MKIANYRRRILIVAVASLVTCFTLYRLVADPAGVIHEMGGDGMKNYYTYIYHSMYGNGLWFDGMNYPIGEHISYVDAQPLLSVSLSYLRHYITLTPDILTIILNFYITFSFFLAIIFVCKILLKFKVNHIWAIVFASLIVVMSTQNFRLFGLYGLYYPCFLPMSFYCYLCYYEHESKKHIAYIFILSCVAMFMHPYLLVNLLVFGVLYIVGYLLLKWSVSKKVRLKHVVPVLIAVMSPVIILKLFTLLTDTVTDRPTRPEGFFSYGTTYVDIFSSGNSPYWTYFKTAGLVNDIPNYGNWYAYTGIAAILVMIIAFVAFIYTTATGRKFIAGTGSPIFNPIWIFIGAGALLFSMGVPFIWGMEWLYDYIGPLRQFRSLGWFALIFYYTATIFSATILYRHYKKKMSEGKIITAKVLFFLPLLIWTGEAYGVALRLRLRAEAGTFNHKYFYSKIDKGWNHFLAEHHYTPNDFQAILHVPYFHIGSEKLWSVRSLWGVNLSMRAAFHLHLPLVDAHMSRSSWEQTFKQVRISGGPFTHKPMLDELKDSRPYLLLHFIHDELNPYDRYIIGHADSLGVLSDMAAYILYPEKIKLSDEKARERVLSVSKDNGAGDSSLGKTDFYYMHCDTGKSKQVFFGKGAGVPFINTPVILASVDVEDWEKDIEYESSVWFLVNDKDYTTPAMKISMLDSAGMEIDSKIMAAIAAIDFKDMWFRASVFFKMPANCKTILVNSLGEAKDVYYAYDELLIRQEKDTVMSKDIEGRVMANNHLLLQ